MSVPGSDVLHTLRRLLDRVRGELKVAQDDYAHVEDRLAEFVAKRREAIVELAAHALPRLDAMTVANTFDAVRDDLTSVLARKQRRDERLQSDLARQQEEHDRVLADLATIDGELRELAEERERLEKELAARLAADAEFQRASKLALQAEERLHRNEERYAEVRDDADAKLPGYDESRLFRYLYDRRFGRPEYTSGGLTKRMDRWVAKLIDFPSLRQGYEFLQRTPELMRLEIERRRTEFEELMELVETMETEAEAASGLPELEPRETELQRRRERVERDLASRSKRLTQATTAVEATQQDDDRFHREALGRLERFLETVKAEVLSERAERTPESRDDEIVADLNWLTTEIASLKPELEERQAERDAAKQRVAGLEFVAKRFQQSELDAPNAIFPATFDVDEAVERFLVGAIDQRALWDEVRSHHETDHTPLEELATDIGQSGSMGRVLWRAMTELPLAAARDTVTRSVRRRSGR